MSKYVECEFPSPAKESLVAAGARPIKAIAWRRSNAVSFGLFSLDPSGDNGELEYHLSVSASTEFVGRRMPTHEEVEEAAKAVGLVMDYCQISKHMLGVHLFYPVEHRGEEKIGL